MVLKLIRKLAGEEDLLLRLALGVPIIWAGARSILNPTDWIGFVPGWVETVVAKEIFLTAHGYGEVILGVLLLSGFAPLIISLLAFLDVSSILVFYGVDDITFRDVGLAIVAIVLFVRQFKK